LLILDQIHERWIDDCDDTNVGERESDSLGRLLGFSCR
jgi:hypothetical protein